MTFLVAPFSQHGKVGVFCQDFELVERDVVIGFDVLIVIYIGKSLFLTVVELKARWTFCYDFLYNGSESIALSVMCIWRGEK